MGVHNNTLQNGNVTNSTYYKTICVTKRYELHNGTCQKKGTVTKWYMLQNCTVCVTKRYMLENGTSQKGTCY